MQKLDFQEYIQQEQPEKLVLLYHWDTDGIASAAQFLNVVSGASPNTQVTLMTPTLNHYYLDEEEFQRIAAVGAQALLTTDINFPLDVIERLEKEVPHVFVFDHHTQTAGINRPGVQDTSYPGCSMLVNDYLMQPLSLVGVLGMVGDQEDKIKERADFYPQVEEMMKEHHLSFDDMQRITKLVDGMYMVGDTVGVEYAVGVLREDPKRVLTDERFAAAEQQLQVEMERELGKEIEHLEDSPTHELLLQEIDSTANIISEVTRARAKEFPSAFIISTQVAGNDGIVYVRSRVPGVDLSPLVAYAREKGYNAGGKPEVAGAVLPAEDLEQYLDELIGEVMAIMP